jgi:hypothetical protein
MRAEPIPSLPPPAAFDAQSQAAAIMAIDDQTARRAELRRVVATLDDVSRNQLQTEITRIKQRREAELSWIDEV